MIPRVFQGLESFGFVHHRALNSADTLEQAALQARTRPDLEHIVEGDLCWNLHEGDWTFYFRHPDFLTDRLDRAQLEQARERGDLLTLDQVLERPHPHLRYIIELKVGSGPTDQAMAALAGELQRSALAGRYWLDLFSLRLARAVKQADPAVPVSLHTKLVAGGLVLRSAPEFFPLSLHAMAGLSCADAITLTYKTSTARLFSGLGATIDGSCSGILAAGKVLLLGGLTTPAAFRLASRSRALAGYAKFSLSDLPPLEAP